MVLGFVDWFSAIYWNYECRFKLCTQSKKFIHVTIYASFLPFYMVNEL